MSASSMSIADRPPEDPAQASAFHAGLIEKLNTAARDWHGWTGSRIADFGKSGGITFLQLAEGEAFATLDDLRAFREEQRRRREAAENDNEAGQGRPVTFDELREGQRRRREEAADRDNQKDQGSLF